jgi:hypothetical protein
MLSTDSQAQRARRQEEIPLSVLCRFPGPALTLSRSSILADNGSTGFIAAVR